MHRREAARQGIRLTIDEQGEVRRAKLARYRGGVISGGP